MDIENGTAKEPHLLVIESIILKAGLVISFCWFLVWFFLG